MFLNDCCWEFRVEQRPHNFSFASPLLRCHFRKMCLSTRAVNENGFQPNQSASFVVSIEVCALERRERSESTREITSEWLQWKFRFHDNSWFALWFDALCFLWFLELSFYVSDGWLESLYRMNSDKIQGVTIHLQIDLFFCLHILLSHSGNKLWTIIFVIHWIKIGHLVGIRSSLWFNPHLQSFTNSITHAKATGKSKTLWLALSEA